MLLAALTEKLTPVITSLGLPESCARVTVADRPDLADVQCNGALQGAKALGQPPRAIAEKIVAAIKEDAQLSGSFSDITIAGPGFINFKLAPSYLAAQLTVQSGDKKFGFVVPPSKKILLEYNSPNMAKDMHVGHLRNTMLGDAVKRMLQFSGHNVITDNHLGDWGLQLGQVFSELQRQQPNLPYFQDMDGPFPSEAPMTFEELCVIYPLASKKAKEDPAELARAQDFTAQLHNGHKGLRALWQHIVTMSVADIKKKLDEIDVESMDTWYGESYMEQYIPMMMDELAKKNITEEIDGAIGIQVAQPDDKFDIPPLILAKKMGGVTYGATDLATFYQRQKDFDPDVCIVLTDFRQELHFERVYRAAKRAGYADRMEFVHLMYGTINGNDGKPYKTRAGSTPRFEELVYLSFDKARERLKEIKLNEKLSPEEFEATARQIGLASIKFGDLINHRRSDYIFDIDKFVSFEGKTGPYIQYTAVRINALLAKAKEQGAQSGRIAVDEHQHEVALLLLQFPEIVLEAATQYAPNILADYLFRLAQGVNRYYQNVHVLSESDAEKRGAALAFLQLSARILTQGLSLIGIMVPTKM
ncbi:MAG TPA: arginine--tRNA ligase [Alphaproteobacteria bacterium]